MSGADVTGDGVDDVLVSAYEYYGNIEGSALLLCGKSRRLLERFDPQDLDRAWLASNRCDPSGR